jgi:photosynthetic reaction center cytochrome c subunit
MTKHPRNLALPTVALTTLLMCAVSNAQTRTPTQTTEQSYKNIQVLKGLPSNELIPAMQFMTASLGVECDFCHAQGGPEKDDKKPKQIARKMMTMMFAINKENFDGHRVVTCNTCHRGSPRPIGTPIIAEADAKMAMPAMESESGEDAKTPTGPNADQVIDKYLQALGGAAAIEKVNSRLEKGNAEVMGKKTPIDIYAKAPDKRVSVMHMANGDSITAYDGTAGWLAFPGRPTRDMTPSESASARFDADLHFATDLKQIFTEIKPAPPTKIGDRETYVLLAMRESQPPAKLYFDQQSGLLVRMLRFSDSPLGLNPAQIDYADYRDVHGVKTPFRWTLTRTSGAFTIQIDSVEQNIPIDDAKFVRPQDAPPPKPPGQ